MIFVTFIDYEGLCDKCLRGIVLSSSDLHMIHLYNIFLLLYLAEDSHAIKMWFNVHTWLKIGVTLTAGKKKTCFAKHER